MLGGAHHSANDRVLAEIDIIRKQLELHNSELMKLESFRSSTSGKRDSLLDMQNNAEISARKSRIKKLEEELKKKEELIIGRVFKQRKMTNATSSSTGTDSLGSFEDVTMASHLDSLKKLRQEADTKFKLASVERQRNLLKKGVSSIKLRASSAAAAEDRSQKKVCVLIQPVAGGSQEENLPPIILAGRPDKTMKYLKDAKVQAFIKYQAKKFASEAGLEGKGKIGFVLTALDDPNEDPLEPDPSFGASALVSQVSEAERAEMETMEISLEYEDDHGIGHVIEEREAAAIGGSHRDQGETADEDIQQQQIHRLDNLTLFQGVDGGPLGLGSIHASSGLPTTLGTAASAGSPVVFHNLPKELQMAKHENEVLKSQILALKLEKKGILKKYNVK